MEQIKTKLWKFRFKHPQEFLGEIFYTESVVADTEERAMKILEGTYGRLKKAVRCTGSEDITLFDHVMRAEPKARLI